MVILLDLNTPMESVDATLWEDAPFDTLMLIASRRGAASLAPRPAPIDTGVADLLDDDARITWEDAEWR